MFKNTSFDNFIKKYPQEYWDQYDRLFVAVSGGRDSVYLFYILLHFFGSKKLCVLHVNHGLRETAKRDESFVNELCDENQVEIKIKRYNLYELPQEKGLENTARNLRYRWFSENCIGSNGALFCGHTLNDQVETILMNLYRGTGLNGLSGMSLKSRIFNIDLFRPIINSHRNFITIEMHNNDIKYCDDESNFQNDYFRNQVRNLLMPKVSKSIIKRLLSIQIASSEILNQIKMPKLKIYNHMITLKMVDDLGQNRLVMNQVIDLIYRKFLIEGSPSKRVKNLFFDFLKSKLSTNHELNSFVTCEKSRNELCFFKNKNSIISSSFKNFDEFKTSEMSVWNQIGLIQSAELPLKCEFYFQLPKSYNIDDIQIGFLPGLDRNVRLNLKKKMEGYKIPAFFYEIWPIILHEDKYYLSLNAKNYKPINDSTLLCFSRYE